MLLGPTNFVLLVLCSYRRPRLYVAGCFCSDQHQTRSGNF